MRACIAAGSEKPHINAFAVLIRVSPHFLDGTHIPQYTIYAANQVDNVWGWIELSDEERAAVGEAMVSINAAADQWFWAILLPDTMPAIEPTVES
jgi:hypothetical protein